MRDERGAKAILEEVERHRRLAEEMDRKRREEAKRRRMLAEEGGEGANAQEQNAQSQSRQKLDELLAKASGVEGVRAEGEQQQQEKEEKEDPTAEAMRRLQELVPQANGGEMDRRGVPREDGQEKVWEV